MLNKKLLFYWLMSSVLTAHAFDFKTFNPVGKIHDNDIISAYRVMADQPLSPEKFVYIKLLSSKLRWSLHDLALYVMALDEVKSSLGTDWLKVPPGPVIELSAHERASIALPAFTYEAAPSDQTIVGAYRVMAGRPITQDAFERCKKHRSLLKLYLLVIDETITNLNMPALHQIETFPITLPNKITIFGYKSDKFIAGSLARYGSWDSHMEVAMRKIIKPGDTVLDIGANIGYFTAIFAECVGRKGKVCAFEPLAPLVGLLKKCKYVNRLNQVEIYPYALSDRAEKIFIKINPISPGVSQFVSPAEVARYEPRFITSVKTITLDALFKQRLQRLNLIKIDIEGMEDLALKGADGHIKKFHPMIIWEFNPWAYEKRVMSPQALLEYYENLGYMFGIVKDIASLPHPDHAVLRAPMSGVQVLDYLKKHGLIQIDILAVWKGSRV